MAVGPRWENPPEALLRGYTPGIFPSGSSLPWLLSIPPSWLRLL